MLQETIYTLCVIWANTKKDIKIALTDRAFTIMSILTPINMFLLMSLFVAGSGSVPVAVVMQDTGPYAQKFYASLNSTHALSLQQVPGDEQANDLLRSGHVVAIITITQELDQRIRQRQPVKVKFQVNNLNTSFTNVIRRAIATSITNFYVSAFPGTITIFSKESDVYTQDTGYMQYLAAPILVMGCMIGSLVQAGTAAANEWEKQTIKESLLSPARHWTIVIGKMLSSLIINLIAMTLILTIIVLILHIQPVHWEEVVGFGTVCILLFVSLGTLLGTIVKQRKDVIILAMAFSFPLFFLSSPFGPLAFNAKAIQFVAQLIPTYHTVTLLQHAFHNFPLDSHNALVDLCILCSYILLFILLSTIALRRSAGAH